MRRRRDHKELKGLIGDISHRVETLEMVVSHMFGPFHRAILESLFSNGNSALKTLVLHSEGIYKNAFIISTDVVPGVLGGDFSRCEVLLTEEQLERAFSTVTVLHACGIFPPWSSTAYHGLVDLRLRSTTRWSDIEETELVSILRSSPGLRILHFELAVRNPAPDTKRVIPVHLLELQVVKVFLSNNSDVSSNSLLRLLAPGSKPLWLSLDGAFKLDDDLNVELDEFFARSRVAKFYANKSILPLNLLLRYSTNLECVTFDSFDSQFHHALLVVERTQADELAPSSRLESLRLLHSSLSEESLRILVTYCPSGIVLDTSFVWRDEESQHTMLTDEEILSAFPTVRVSGSSMNSPTVY